MPLLTCLSEPQLRLTSPNSSALWVDKEKTHVLRTGDARDKVDVGRMPMTVDNPEGTEGAAPEGPSLGWMYVHSTSTESIHPESSASLHIAH